MKSVMELVFAHDLQGLEVSGASSPSIDSTDERGRTALGWAAANGYVGGIRKLIELGANPNGRNNDGLGYTPLIEAARAGHLHAVQALVRGGAELNGQDFSGGTALLGACIAAYPEILSWLLDQGASLHLVDEQGYGPVEHLCEYAKSWSGMITLIIDGREVPQEKPGFQEHTDMLALLLRRGANARRCVPQGHSALHLAARSGAAAFVPLLVAHGADVNLTNKRRRTPLHVAAEEGHVDVLSELIQAGAKLNTLEASGYTPLMLAVLSRRTNAVRLLQESGATL